MPCRNRQSRKGAVGSKVAGMCTATLSCSAAWGAEAKAMSRVTPFEGIVLEGLLVARLHVEHLDRGRAQRGLELRRCTLEERVGAVVHRQHHLGLDPFLGGEGCVHGI